jgi:Domain of unknown function (DUF5680)
MPTLLLDALEKFIVCAKAATYVGSGAHSPSHRPGSHDLEFHEAPFAYLDSYFGGSDFIGEEVIYYNDQPVWAENYYGRILTPASITGAEAGQVIKESLTRMYQEGRFLGGFEHTTAFGVYHDTNQGPFTSFTGKEWIERDSRVVYELHYHGGLIKD